MSKQASSLTFTPLGHCGSLPNTRWLSHPHNGNDEPSAANRRREAQQMTRKKASDWNRRSSVCTHGPHARSTKGWRKDLDLKKKKKTSNQGNEDQIIQASNGRPSRIRSSPSEQQTCERAILGGFHPPPPLTTLPHLWPRPDEHYLLPSFSLAALSLRLLPLSTSCLP